MNAFGLGCFLALATLSTALPHTQIIGGKEVKQGELPYQIKITSIFNITFCGGSLVVVEDKQFVLTSGDCGNSLYQYNFRGFTLVAGDLNSSESSGREQVRIPNRVIFSEDWDFVTKNGDIAIIGYEEPFELTEDVQPISLPLQGQSTTGDVLISGWGSDNASDYSESDVLRKWKVPVIPDEDCQQLYESHLDYALVPYTICSQRREGGTGHCSNDLGGPAVAVDGGYLAGVISYPESCITQAQGYPDVYTEVSHYSDWIKLRARDL